MRMRNSLTLSLLNEPLYIIIIFEIRAYYSKTKGGLGILPSHESIIHHHHLRKRQPTLTNFVSWWSCTITSRTARDALNAKIGS